MKQVILCRAFGDFIIALETASRSILLQNIEQIQRSEIKLVASMHLKPLYDAIPTEFKNPNIVIEFVDFAIKGSLLRAFTNKYLLHPNTLVELRQLKKWLHQQPLHDTFVLEQAYRKKILQWFTGKSFMHIADGGNVYEQFEHFFNAAPLIGNKERSNAHDEQNNKQIILILPAARLAFRHIPYAICKQVITKHTAQGHEVKIAYFNQSIHGKQTFDDALYFHNFDTLVQLILSANLIYCPDSLPMHLAFLLKKPHIVLHPAKPASGFLTPYALQHHSHFNFEDFIATAN